MVRKRIPQPALAVAPVLVSDATAHALVGLSPRRFREFVGAHPELPRIREGQRLLVPDAALIALAQPQDGAPADAPVNSDDAIDNPCDPAAIVELARRRTA